MGNGNRYGGYNPEIDPNAKGPGGGTKRSKPNEEVVMYLEPLEFEASDDDIAYMANDKTRAEIEMMKICNSPERKEQNRQNRIANLAKSREMQRQRRELIKQGIDPGPTKRELKERAKAEKRAANPTKKEQFQKVKEQDVRMAEGHMLKFWRQALNDLPRLYSAAQPRQQFEMLRWATDRLAGTAPQNINIKNDTNITIVDVLSNVAIEYRKKRSEAEIVNELEQLEMEAAIYEEVNDDDTDFQC